MEQNCVSEPSVFPPGPNLPTPLPCCYYPPTPLHPLLALSMPLCCTVQNLPAPVGVLYCASVRREALANVPVGMPAEIEDRIVPSVTTFDGFQDF